MEQPRPIDSINLERAVWYLVAVAVPLTSSNTPPASGGGSILQENGDGILQENGDVILQEA